MGGHGTAGGTAVQGEELEIAADAIVGYARLLRAVGGRIATHPARDGGLICEQRAGHGHRSMWRIAPDGSVLADHAYNYGLRAFVASRLPDGLAPVA